MLTAIVVTVYIIGMLLLVLAAVLALSWACFGHPLEIFARVGEWLAGSDDDRD